MNKKTHKENIVFVYFKYIFKILTALFVIFTSIYDIMDDFYKIQKEQGVLIIGLFIFGEAIYEFCIRIKKISGKLKRKADTVNFIQEK